MATICMVLALVIPNGSIQACSRHAHNGISHLVVPRVGMEFIRPVRIVLFG